MADKELEHLVEMANQIAVNFRFHDDPVDRIADHLTRFWAPSMRRKLRQHVDGGGAGLEAEVVQAAGRLGSA